MQQEGQKIVNEGIAQTPDAIDVVMVNGYGFPRWRGGPMFMAR
jgi:3-hydroxyacyl-CoA dehydrogenase